MQTENESSTSTPNSTKRELITTAHLKTWLKRLGFWGLVFFLVKGLLWLIIPALVAMFALD